MSHVYGPDTRERYAGSLAFIGDDLERIAILADKAVHHLDERVETLEAGTFSGDISVADDASVAGDLAVTGNATVGGTLGVTGATTVAALTASGAITPNAGIAFPATQVVSANANTLDDYEEGTWTPVLGGSGGTSGQTYATQQASYIKVGRLVTCTCYVELSVKGTITGTVELQGLPFTVASSTNGGVGIGRWFSFATAYVSLSLQINANSTKATVYGATAATTDSATLATANIANATGFMVTFSYIASQ